MIVRIIRVYVKPEHVEEFERETTLNHEGSIREAGVLRFDVLRMPDGPGEYVLYEAYRDEQATIDHKATAHYARWKERVAGMMDRDRESESFEVVVPTDPASWAMPAQPAR